MLKIGPVRSPALRALARGQPCVIEQIPGVYLLLHKDPFNHDPQTVVWAHSNLPEHGKATRRKADDPFGFLACGICHAAIDQGRHLSNDNRRRLQREGMMLTRAYLIETMLIVGAIDADIADDVTWLEGWRSGRIQVAP